MIFKLLKNLTHRNVLTLAALMLLLFSGTVLGVNDPKGEVPEIPPGSGPFLLMGLLGAILWLRNLFNKK